MHIRQEEVEKILADETKRIYGDIIWDCSDRNGTVQKFSAKIDSDVGWPIRVVGNFRPTGGKISFLLVHDPAGRFYALDLGSQHSNPGRELVGDTHKHVWKDETRDHWAYHPEDITAEWDHPLELWRQFCAEAKIIHKGEMKEPLPVQRRLLR